MEREYILNKIRQGEGLKIEFKESVTSLPKEFYETAVSFSNTDGGIIVLGVQDSGDIIGVSLESIKQIIADLVTNLNSPDCVSPSLFVNPTPIDIDGKIIIIVQIQSSSSVHTYANKTYIRSGDADIDISGNQEKIDELRFQKSSKFTESTIYPHLSMNDLNPILFEKARGLIRGYKSDHPWLMVSDEQMLRESSLWRKDFRTGEEGLTLAAALIFGLDTTIQSILPAYKVEAMTRIENLDRYDDRITKRTNLIDTYLSLKEFINKWLPDKFYMEGDQRVDLRDKIFREVIGNIIIHREYTNPMSTDMIVYKDHVMVTNPNKAIFHGVLDPQKFNPYPKNPNIRKFFTAFGWTDEIGSGVRNTNKYLPIYAKGATPKFVEENTFITEIPLSRVTLIDYLDKWTKWLSLEESEFNVSLSKIPVGREYANLSWEELLLKLICSWSEKVKSLPNLSWPNNQVDSEDAVVKLKDWDIQSSAVLRKKVWYYIVVLSLCGNSIDIKTILKTIGYKDRAGFTNNYIKPLRESGLITNTENLNSPNVKYQITEDGKRFLAG